MTSTAPAGGAGGRRPRRPSPLAPAPPSPEPDGAPTPCGLALPTIDATPPTPLVAPAAQRPGLSGASSAASGPTAGVCSPPSAGSSPPDTPEAPISRQDSRASVSSLGVPASDRPVATVLSELANLFLFRFDPRLDSRVLRGVLEELLSHTEVLAQPGDAASLLLVFEQLAQEYFHSNWDSPEVLLPRNRQSLDLLRHRL